jgi:hypothetical protein
MAEYDVFENVSPEVPAASAPVTPAIASSPARTDNLAQARTSKIDRLANRVGLGPQDRTDGFAAVGGYNESLRNKVLNDYSQYELDYVGQRLNNQYGVIETSQGLMHQNEDGTMVPYEGDPKGLMSYYEFGTKNGNIKRGTWGGRNPADRYANDYLSSRKTPDYVGEEGVDVNQLKRHYLLPADVARTYEALQHGSSKAMENRIIRDPVNGDRSAYFAGRDRIGSGATEVYRNVPTTAPENFDGDTLYNTVNDRFAFGAASNIGTGREAIADSYRQQAQLTKQNSYAKPEEAKVGTQSIADSYRQQAEGSVTTHESPGGFINRSANTGAAVGAGLTRSLILDSAAAAASLFGKELGTADSRRETANNLFGYDESYSQEAMQRVSDRVGRMYDAKELDMNDLLAITGDAITNPEIIGDSVGVLIGTFAGLGKFTKIGKAISNVEKAYRGGRYTATEAKAAVSNIKSTESLWNNVAHLTASNAGYAATVAGTTNNAVDQFLENNNGEATVFDVLRIGAFQAAITGIDRFAGAVALRDIPGIRSIGMFSPESTKAMKAVVSQMPADVYSKTADAVAKVLSGTAKLGASSSLEGVTEYVQTMGDLFSQQYATEKYGDEFGQLFGDRANQIESLASAAIGSTMGAEMHVANQGVGSLTSALQSGVQAAKQAVTNKASAAPAQPTAPQLSEEEIADQDTDRKSYSTTLNRLTKNYVADKINPSSLTGALSDLAELDRTRYAVEGKADETELATADEVLEQIKSHIATLVTSSPDGNFTLSHDSVEGSSELPRQQVGANAQSFTNVNAQAARDQADLLDLTGSIEEEFAKGKTAKQVQMTLENAMASIPLEDRADFIVSVRATLGIPSQADEEGKKEFTAWKAARDNRATASTLNSRPLTEKEQRALAESAINIVAERRAADITPDEITKLNNFGTANGLDADRIDRIIKSHSSVESEATVEERGVMGRERNLDTLLNAEKPNSKRVQAAYDEASQWLSKTLGSIQELEDGVRKAEEMADSSSRSTLNSTKPITVLTDYIKFGGKPFDIQLRHNGTKYVADTRIALQRIADKQRTASNLRTLLEKFHNEAADVLDSASTLDAGSYRIPTEVKGSSEEIKYVKSVEKVLATIPKAGKKINRIIVGGKPDPRWNPRSRATAMNSLRTNVASKGDSYASTDVVYVHAAGKISAKNSAAKSELYKESSPAGKNIAAAIEAGATIVLDSDYQAGTTEGALVARYLKDNGYLPLGVVNGKNTVEASIFVPDTEESARRLATAKEQASTTKAMADAKEARQKRLADLALEKAAGVSERAPEAIESDIDAAIKSVRDDFLPTARRQLVESGEDVTDEAVEAKLATNVQSYMKNSVAKAVRAFRASVEQTNVPVDSPLVQADKGLQALVQAEITQGVKVQSDAKVLMTAWKKASALRLQGKELIDALNTALEVNGKHVATKRKDDNTIVLREVGDSILGDSAGSTNTIKSYAVEYQVINPNGSVTTVTEHPKFNPANYPVGKEEVREVKRTYINNKADADALRLTRELEELQNSTNPDEELITEIKRQLNIAKNVFLFKVLNINEITHNPTDYLSVTGITPLNTLSVDKLPPVFKKVADNMEAALKEVMSPLDKSEVGIKAGKRPKETEDYVRQMIDSPARSLIFDKDGNINSNTSAAMAIALGDLIKTDSFKLTLGKKDVTTLANMFRVTETEVTSEMRQMAEEHGTLAKSVAHNLGTSTLKALGITKLKADNVNRGQYERMVSDLGNYVIAGAEKQGILKTTEEKSDTLSEVFRDADTLGTDATTLFVHIPSKKANANGAMSTSFNKATTALSSDYDLISRFIPDATGNRKEPRFGSPIPQAEQEDILSSIRNDAVGGNIPAEAKETLRHFMNTPYEMDLENVGKFLSELEDTTTQAAVLKSLGYIEASENNPEYVKLPFVTKEIQEAINRDVENSIANVRQYYEAIQNGLPNEMYFPFYYTSNHRYMMNSNTLNGQADKLHRFFIYPKAHKVEYKFNRVNNTFTYNYEENGVAKSINSSLYVRAALAQSMGFDIDKEATSDIIRFGNELLSMSPADIESARKTLLNTGSFVLVTDKGADTIEPTHLSHALQGLEFLRKYKTAEGDTFSDALSAEYDALTSGFSNKVQQFGTVSTTNPKGVQISTRSEHMRRVGIIGPDNGVADLFQDAGVGINDMLSDKSLLDSYKNLARDTILDLNRQVSSLSTNSAKLFDDLSALLPGADQRAVESSQITISSALRKLFKPGFMIFNYSAGIGRITANLGDEMVAEMMNQIATADLKVLTPEMKQAMEALAALVYVNDKKSGITLDVLQKRIRNEPLYNLKVKTVVYNDQGMRKQVILPIDQYLVKEIISPTYGNSVKESFTKNFAEFIEIQNVTNDAFKLSFAVFGKLLQQKVDAYRIATNSAPISEQQMLSMIGELREAFPVIADPLSSALEDGVYVYTTETRTPKGTLATTTSPLLRYAQNAGNPRKSRRMNPLIRSLVAAANAGAVLPFHALDGAQMSRTTNEFVSAYMSKINGAQKGAGILPVHDAIIPPLPFSDIIGHIYNKNTVELNQNYSVIGEMKKLVERVNRILTDKDSELKLNADDVKAVTSLSFINNKAQVQADADVLSATRRLKQLENANNPDQALIAQAKVELNEAKNVFSFKNTFAHVQQKVNLWNEQVEAQRATMFAPGTKVGVLVTTGGGVFTVGQDNVDLSYLDNLHGLYEKVKVSVPAEVQAEEVETSVPVSIVVPNKDETLSADQTAEVEAQWSIAVNDAVSSLKYGEYLIFSKQAVETRDLGDDSVNGESYVFNRVMETGDYDVSDIEVDGVKVYQVSKVDADNDSTLINADWDGIITEFDTVSNKKSFKDTVNKFKDHTKRCK